MKSKTKSKSLSKSLASSAILSHINITGEVYDKIRRRITRNVCFARTSRVPSSSPNLLLNPLNSNSNPHSIPNQKEIPSIQVQNSISNTNSNSSKKLPQGYLLLDFSKQLPRSKTHTQWAPSLYKKDNLKLKKRQKYYEGNEMENDYNFEIYKANKYPMSNLEIPSIKLSDELKPLNDFQMKDQLRQLYNRNKVKEKIEKMRRKFSSS